MDRRLIVAFLVMSVVVMQSAVYADSSFHYKTYNREVDIYADGTYRIFENIEILGMADGVANVDLGSSFVVKSVKVSEDGGKTWATIGESNYIVGNVLKHDVVKDKNYRIQVQAQGVGAKSSFSTSTPKDVDQVYIDIDFKFDDVVMSSVEPSPTHKSDNSVDWVFTDKYAKRVSVSFATINNDAELDVNCDALVLAGSLNKMKLFCDVSADESIDRVEISLPSGVAFSSFDTADDFEVDEVSPLVIRKKVPSRSFKISDLELDVMQDSLAMPGFQNSGVIDYNLALYSSDSYKVDGVVSTFSRVTKYEADFLGRISGHVPSGYNLDSLYVGKSVNTLSFDKEKLKEKEHLATSINSANYDIFPTKRGFAIVKANYDVVNSETGKYLELELPDNSVFWGAIVNSEPEKAYGEGNVVQIQLPLSQKYGASYQSIRVTVFYVVTREVFDDNIYSSYNLVLPKYKSPITNIYVKVGLPLGFEYWKTDVNPEMDAKLMTYTPRKVYYDREINFDVAGAAQKAMASQIEEMSMETPVQRVQLSLNGAPITVQIPDMKKYVQITGGGESIIMPGEAVSISIYGLDSNGLYVIYGLVGILIFLIILWKKDKIKKLIW